jgi:hypothetical protein
MTPEERKVVSEGANFSSKNIIAEDAAAEELLKKASSAMHRALSYLPGPLAPSFDFAGPRTAKDDEDGKSPDVSAGLSGALIYPSTVRFAARCWYSLALVYRAQGSLGSAVGASITALRHMLTYFRFEDYSPLHGWAEVLDEVAATLCFLAESHYFETSFDSANFTAQVAVVLRPSDPVSWYLLALSHRSLARRSIGDSSPGAGLDHVRSGLEAAGTALRLSENGQTAWSSLHGHCAGDLTADALLSFKGVAPIWKLLADLYSICYDALPSAFGAVSSAMLVHGEVFESASWQTGVPPELEDLHNVSRWVAANVPVVNEASLAALLESSSSSTEQSLASFAPLIAESARDSSISYARLIETLVSSQPLDLSPMSVLGVSMKSRDKKLVTAGSLPFALANALCDLGRVLYLQSLSIVYACGSSGLALLLQDEASDANGLETSLAARPFLSSALIHCARLRRMAASVHRAALRVMPVSARAWNGLGVCEHDFALARYALSRSMELGGGGIALVNLAALYSQHGHTEMVWDALMEAQTRDPNNSSMWLVNGSTHELSLSRASAASVKGMLGGVEDATQASAAFLLARELVSHPSVLGPSAYRSLVDDCISRGLREKTLSKHANIRAPDSALESDYLSIARLAWEKSSNNPLCGLVYARTLAVDAAYCLQTFELLFGGARAFSSMPLDMDLLVAVPCPYYPNVSFLRSSASSGIAAKDAAIRQLRYAFMSVEEVAMSAAQCLHKLCGRISADSLPMASRIFLEECILLSSWALLWQKFLGLAVNAVPLPLVLLLDNWNDVSRSDVLANMDYPSMLRLVKKKIETATEVSQAFVDALLLYCVGLVASHELDSLLEMLDAVLLPETLERISMLSAEAARFHLLRSRVLCRHRQDTVAAEESLERACTLDAENRMCWFASYEFGLYIDDQSRVSTADAILCEDSAVQAGRGFSLVAFKAWVQQCPASVLLLLNASEGKIEVGGPSRQDMGAVLPPLLLSMAARASDRASMLGASVRSARSNASKWDRIHRALGGGSSGSTVRSFGLPEDNIVLSHAFGSTLVDDIIVQLAEEAATAEAEN